VHVRSSQQSWLRRAITSFFGDPVVSSVGRRRDGVTGNAIAAPDGNTTADTITAVTATSIIQQQVAGLTSGGQCTFYVWAKVASGTKQVSAIVDNAYAGDLASPSITLTTAWQRFKVTAHWPAGRPGRGSWCASSPRTATTGVPAGRVPAAGKRSERRLRPNVGVANRLCFRRSCRGSVVIAARDNAESPLRIHVLRSNLADHRLIEVPSTGELLLAGGVGNGYRLAELMGATNPSGWSDVLKVKNPAGATAGYILLYSNPYP
jgi:hypothetical protein